LLVYGMSWHLGPVCAGVNLLRDVS
jgi:hypothetical protein